MILTLQKVKTIFIPKKAPEKMGIHLDFLADNQNVGHLLCGFCTCLFKDPIMFDICFVGYAANFMQILKL
jgi:hypothetical protein